MLLSYTFSINPYSHPIGFTRLMSRHCLIGSIKCCCYVGLDNLLQQVQWHGAVADSSDMKIPNIVQITQLILRVLSQGQDFEHASHVGAGLSRADAVTSNGTVVTNVLQIESLGLLERSFTAGKMGLSDLLVFRRELIEARREHIEATAEAWMARIALDLAVGTLPVPMPGAPQPFTTGAAETDLSLETN